MERTRKTPGPDHPIAIQPSRSRVAVRLGGVLVAESTDALVLLETTYPAVYYLPRHDIDGARLARTDTQSYCPYKGDCTYFSVVGDAGTVRDAAWSYEDPFPAVGAIAGYLAFYPDRVDVEVAPAP